MRKIGCIVFLVIVLLTVAFMYWKYMYVYSEGYREGTLNKFSTKGVAYKTNEGEMLMPGLVSNMGQMSSNNFYFSAVDSNVVNTLLQATGKKVKVHYKQFNSSLPWRGDDYNDKNSEKGQYIVDEAIVVQ